MDDVQFGKAAQQQAPAQNDPIRHVVVLLMENHSFDQMLGCLDEVHKDLDGVRNAAAKTNDDGKGHVFSPRPTYARQMKLDPDHRHSAVLRQIDGDNSGFVRSFTDDYPKSSLGARQDIMGYYPRGFLPALHYAWRALHRLRPMVFVDARPDLANRYFALSGTSKAPGRHARPASMRLIRSGTPNRTRTRFSTAWNEAQKRLASLFLRLSRVVAVEESAQAREPRELPLLRYVLPRCRRGRRRISRVCTDRAEVLRRGTERRSSAATTS